MSTAPLDIDRHQNAPEPAAAVPPPPPPTASWRRWLREPLLHFVVLGGLLFGIDGIIVGRANDPHTIVVGGDVDREAIEVFKASRGHDPSPDELTALRQVWLDNEVLYREGLALQVDKGDESIRERVIFKALSMIDANVKLPPADDNVLRKWFESHRDKYDEPPRYSFQEAALSGDTSEAAVRAFVQQLNAGAPGDAKAGLRVFKGRPQANIVQSYGAEFAKALAASPKNVWAAMKTKDGWRAIRVDGTSAAKPAVYEAVRNTVRADWTDATAAEQRTAAVRALAKKYNVRHEVSAKPSIE
jgi:hypothetical protein